MSAAFCVRGLSVRGNDVLIGKQSSNCSNGSFFIEN